jgi:hypothetical protein
MPRVFDGSNYCSVASPCCTTLKATESFSLLPDVDRLVISVIFTLDTSGRVIASRIGRGVVRSRAKLTYNGVGHGNRFRVLETRYLINYWDLRCYGR